MCEQARQEYAQRLKDRGDEIGAINETIKILTSDETRELFAKTVSFIQLDSSSSNANANANSNANANANGNANADQKAVLSVAFRQKQAMQSAIWKVLRVARKNRDLLLASFVARAKLDAFGKVKLMR